MVGVEASRASSAARYCCKDCPDASARRCRFACTSSGTSRTSTFGMLAFCYHWEADATSERADRYRQFWAIPSRVAQVHDGMSPAASMYPMSGWKGSSHRDGDEPRGVMVVRRTSPRCLIESAAGGRDWRSDWTDIADVGIGDDVYSFLRPAAIRSSSLWSTRAGRWRNSRNPDLTPPRRRRAAR